MLLTPANIAYITEGNLGEALPPMQRISRILYLMYIMVCMGNAYSKGGILISLPELQRVEQYLDCDPSLPFHL